MKLNKNRIWAIMKKEVKQIRRDRRSFGILIFLPVFMLFMFGYALTFDVSHVKMAIWDQDKSSESREFANQFFNTEYFDYEEDLNSDTRIDYLLDSREAVVVMIIPADFSKKLMRNEKSDVQFLIDGSNANEATTIQSYISLITQNYSSRYQAKFFERNGQKQVLPMDIQSRVWYNPELKSSRYLIPGLVVYIMMIMSVISTAVSVVKEKEKRTMEQLIVSPVLPVELILGKTLPYLFMSLLSTYFILTMGYVLFDASVVGNHFMLFLVVFIFLIGGLGLGLMISSVAENQAVAFLMATFVSVLPTILLSGFMFPIESMAVPLQYISMIIPGRYFLKILREIIIKGSGVEAYWKELLGLVVFAVFIINVSRVRLGKIIG